MTRQEAYDRTGALMIDFNNLRFNVSNDNDLHDCENSVRFSEHLLALTQDIFTEVLFAQLSEEIEDDKSLFIVQKKSKIFFDEILLTHIDGLIKMSKQWKFHDYRVINLQREAKDLATEIRNMYIEIYW